MVEFRLLNGLNADQFFQTIEIVKENPELAAFKFRAQNTWLEGTHSRATVKGFYGALREEDGREGWEFEIDEPQVLCGWDVGANPAEYLLIALSGCLTTSLIAHAAVKRIEIKRVESRYEGDLDLRGFLGLAEEVPVGFQTIRVSFAIEADIPETQKEELIRMAQKYSPIFNTISKATPVSVQLE
ncbi:MAG: OsmC family protein [Desulfobaccales bacterium]